MPRFTYKVDGKLDEVVRDDAKFKAFAAELRRDTESVLSQYDIADKAMLRRELGIVMRLDYLDGRYDDALKAAERIRELEEKPADKLLSGLSLRAMIAAERKVGNKNSDAYRGEVNRLIGAELATMPYEIVQNEIKEGKAGAEILSEALALGIRAGADPQALFDVISSSAGSSWMWQNRVPHILEGDDTPLSAVNIFVKDLGIVLDQARALTFPLPMAAAAHQLFLAAAAHGEGAKDDAFVIRVWQALAGIELPKPR